MIDAYATGSSLPALLAALDLAEVGLRVRVALDEGEAHLPETPLRDPEGTLAELMERLAGPVADNGVPHPGLLPRREEPAPVALLARDGEWALQPEPAILGIPAVPLSERSLAILGGAAGARAYLDRIKPLLTIGKTRGIGALVRSRLGRTACERLVEPCVRERFGVDADSVDVAVAAPGLNEAMTRAGSLSGAVLACSERNVARETRIEPVAGWAALRKVLIERLSLYEVEFAEGAVRQVTRGESRWSVEDEGGTFETRALILDRGPVARPPLTGLESELPEAQDRVRVVARAEVERPTWWPAAQQDQADHRGSGAPATPGTAAALRAVSLDSGEVWTARVSTLDGTRWEAELRSPAAPFANPGSGGLELAARDGGSGAALAAAVLDAAVLDAAELTASGEIRCALEAAPYATVAEREAAEGRLEESQRIADPGLLLVGEALLGGDLSAALRAVTGSAVALRRHLTGIAD